MEVRRKGVLLCGGVALAAGVALLCVICALAMAPQAAAQSCAMCYQNASAAGAQGQQALRHGILILMVPTLSMFLGIFGLIYSRRNLAR